MQKACIIIQTQPYMRLISINVLPWWTEDHCSVHFHALKETCWRHALVTVNQHAVEMLQIYVWIYVKYKFIPDMGMNNHQHFHSYTSQNKQNVPSVHLNVPGASAVV